MYNEKKKFQNQIVVIILCLYFLFFIGIKYYLKQENLSTKVMKEEGSYGGLEEEENSYKNYKFKLKKYPNYFKNFIKTKNIKDLMNEYLNFHTNSIKEINSNCNSFYKKKFIIFKPHYYSGFGNIIMGLIPTMLYALLS